MTNHCGHCDRVHQGSRRCTEEWCTGCYVVLAGNQYCIPDGAVTLR